MVNNALAVAATYGELLFPFGPEIFTGLMVVVLLLLGFISFILLLTWKRKSFITRRSPRYDGPPNPLTVGQSAAAIVRAPLFWAPVLVVIAYSVTRFV